MDFAWVWGQVDAAMDGEREEESDCINASSGTPVMTAVWIVRKKALGGRARLLVSSKEQGVQPLALPPTLSISVTAFPLLKSGGIPRQVEVDERPEPLKVQPF
jgi:hypothetical protein